MLKRAVDSGLLGTRINHWNIPPSTFGRAGLVDDFLLRGALQCLGGIISNDPEESVYYNTIRDGAGQALDAARRYRIRFAPGQRPEVEGFWSLTMYDPTFNFTDNAIDRYSIGDRSAGLGPDADGGLTIDIQRDTPGPERASNWLPCPASGPFMLVLRTYIPGAAIVAQQWAPPPGLDAANRST